MKEKNHNTNQEKSPNNKANKNMCTTKLRQLQNSTKGIKEHFSKWRNIL